MAVIGKIRNRMGILLVVFVGVALLAFVLGDLLSSSQYFLNGDRTVIGKMNGSSINYDEFQRRYDQKEKFFSESSQGAALDDETRSGLLDQTWNEFIEQHILDPQYDELGLTVGDLELKDMVGGRFLHPAIQQQFTDPKTGEFNRANLQQYLASISDETNVPEEQLAQWKLARAQWTNFENDMAKNRLQTKYQTLVEKGMYVTSKEIARQYADNGDRYNIRYVGKAFSEVADSTIEVTDEDLKKAYDENKNRFKSDFAIRGLRYAQFDVVPSAKDSAALFARIDSLKAGFQTSTDDTTFIASNTDQQENTPRFLRKELLPKTIDSVIYNTTNGFIYGPYVDGGSYFLAKKMAEKTTPDSVKVTAILIAKNTQQGPRVGAKEKADSLMAAIKAGADIKVLALTNSEDKTTAPDSGNVGWIPYEIAGNPIVDTAYNASVGAVKLVETPDAFAIVRTEGKSAPVRKVLIGFVSLDIKASEETINKAYTAASDFAISHKSLEDFEKETKGSKYIVRDDFLRENAKSITGIEDSRSMVKWAFENKVGAVSGIEQFGNRYIVAIVTKSWSAGVPKFEEIKKDLEPIAKRDKKASKFMEEMKAAAAGGNIDKVGTAIKKPVVPATDITFQSFGVPGAGYEPAIVGAATGGTKGKLVGPFKGVNGVYVVVVDAVNKGANPPATPQQKSEMSRMAGQRVFSELLPALNSALEVRDMRYKFY